MKPAAKFWAMLTAYAKTENDAAAQRKAAEAVYAKYGLTRGQPVPPEVMDRMLTQMDAARIRGIPFDAFVRPPREPDPVDPPFEDDADVVF
jgi:hypothetical protein